MAVETDSLTNNQPRQECPYPEVPLYRTWIPGSRLDQSKTTFSLTENGKALPDVEIAYEELLGWHTGDPRIAALNLIAKLTDSPEVVQHAVELYANLPTSKRIPFAFTTVQDIFARTLMEKSYDSFRFGHSSAFLTGGTLNIWQPHGYSFLFISTVAGIQTEQREERLTAIYNLAELFTLPTNMLHVALDIFRLNGVTKQDPTKELLTGSAKDPEMRTLDANYFSPQTWEKVEQAQATMIDTLQRYEKQLQRIGIVSGQISTHLYRSLVHRELASGLELLYKHKSIASLPAHSSPMVEKSHGTDRYIVSPNQTEEDVHSSKFTPEVLSFIDGSEQVMRTGIGKCPFPNYARRMPQTQGF